MAKTGQTSSAARPLRPARRRRARSQGTGHGRFSNDQGGADAPGAGGALCHRTIAPAARSGRGKPASDSGHFLRHNAASPTAPPEKHRGFPPHRTRVKITYAEDQIDELNRTVFASSSKSMRSSRPSNPCASTCKPPTPPKPATCGMTSAPY